MGGARQFNKRLREPHGIDLGSPSPLRLRGSGADAGSDRVPDAVAPVVPAAAHQRLRQACVPITNLHTTSDSQRNNVEQLPLVPQAAEEYEGLIQDQLEHDDDQREFLRGQQPESGDPVPLAAQMLPQQAPVVPEPAPRPAGGMPEPAGARAASKFYLFTMVHGGEPQWQQPGVLGRAGLWDALRAAYVAAFPADHPCHAGPLYGKVVQELHRGGDPHLHAACAFPERHRRKAVDLHLREQQGVKAPCSKVCQTLLCSCQGPCQKCEGTLWAPSWSLMGSQWAPSGLLMGS